MIKVKIKTLDLHVTTWLNIKLSAENEKQFVK